MLGMIKVLWSLLQPLSVWTSKYAMLGLDHHWKRDLVATASVAVHVWDHNRYVLRIIARTMACISSVSSTVDAYWPVSCLFAAPQLGALADSHLGS